MKFFKKIDKERVWIVCMIIGPLLAYLSIYSPSVSVLAIIIIVIGSRGIFNQIM